MYHHHQLQPVQQPQHHRQPPQYAYHPSVPAMHKLNNKGRQIVTMKNNESQSGGRTLRRPADGGVDLNMNVNRNVVNEGTISDCRSCPPYSEASSMTHDEALRICTLMGSPCKKGFHETPANDFLQNVMSFDFADHHSLSTEHGDMDRDLGSDSLLDEVEAHEEHFVRDQAAKHGDNMLDLSDLLPLELGDGNDFPDLLLLS